MASRPRILYVTNGVPRVPAPGGPTRAFHLVRAASTVGRVSVVAVVDDPATVAPPSSDSVWSDLHDAPAPMPVAPPATLRPIFRAFQWVRATLLGSAPSILWRFDPRPLRATVETLLRDGDVDLVVVEHTELAAALAPTLRRWGGPALADFHNVLSVHQSRVGRLDGQSPSLRRATAFRRAVQEIQALETTILRSYRQVTAVSALDAGELRRLVPTAPIEVIPNGVDVGYFGAARAQPGTEDGVDRLVFTGALWYRPNVDAMQYFVSTILPRIQKSRPNARFDVVGARPSAEVLALAKRPGVAVYPSVDDVRPYLAASSVAVVPLRLGSGTRLKVLEALAAGRPVVSTHLGAEGLDLDPGADVLLADQPEQFADVVLALLDRPEDARALAQHGQATVCQLYDWSKIGARFGKVLTTMLGAVQGGGIEETTIFEKV